MNKYEILKTYFGYDSFRGAQEILIDNILSGKDVLGIMPTGAGKSLCYQIPALMLDGITLVISPLISLMKDQVGSLNQAGIHAAYLNSSLTPGQYRKALAFARQGRYPIIYVAPERLLTPEFLDFAMNVRISMVAVDEAHCVSQWGQDFRPSYLRIADFIQGLPVRPVVSAFTATATKEVRDDILELLELRDPMVMSTGFDRENLYFAVETPRDRYGAVKHYIEEHSGESGIVYCLTRKQVDEVCGFISSCKVLNSLQRSTVRRQQPLSNPTAKAGSICRQMIRKRCQKSVKNLANIPVLHISFPASTESMSIHRQAALSA